MSMLGNVRIGHKAPDFHCEAVISGAIKDVSLSTFIHPNIKPGAHKADSPWLILLFIPAAFSFVCPTEVLAFQNCMHEFKDRNCNVIFVSVDTKHSLWHWQNVPRQYGGLGMIDIPLLSDATHHVSRDYGVLIEEEGVSLRGMFIIDGEGIVQQITLNNLTVGRSVLEALRLLEAFQAVAKHGVLCPIDWKPTGDAADTINTISNTLTESYEERLANLQKEFAGVPVTDLDARQDVDDEPKSATTMDRRKSSGSIHDGRTAILNAGPPRPHSTPPAPSIKEAIKEVACERPKETSPIHSHHDDCLPHSSHSQSLPSPSQSYDPSSGTAPVPPRPTPARQTRGTHTLDARHLTTLFSHASLSIFHPFPRSTTSDTDSSSGHSTAPLMPARLQQNMYESRRGSQVILEFADLTASLLPSPIARPPPLLRASTWTGPASNAVWKVEDETPGQSRLQATFEALRKIGSGLATPRGEVEWNEGEASPKDGDEGYFDGSVEVPG